MSDNNDLEKKLNTENLEDVSGGAVMSPVTSVMPVVGIPDIRPVAGVHPVAAQGELPGEDGNIPGPRTPHVDRALVQGENVQIVGAVKILEP